MARRRQDMLEAQLAGRGVTDARVLSAMASIRREAFVDEDQARHAYDDSPLPIGEGQTISQPLVVAIMAEAVELGPADRVLEVGTGSGYGAAVLGHLAAEVWTIERLPGLADRARRRLEALGCDHVHVVVGDGSLGIPERGPYDAIVVTAGGPQLPPSLLDQLAVGGRLVVPVGDEPGDQHLVRVRRTTDGFAQEDLGPVRFVPLIGEQAWPER